MSAVLLAKDQGGKNRRWQTPLTSQEPTPRPITEPFGLSNRSFVPNPGRLAV
jgi:hypothetical protein